MFPALKEAWRDIRSGFGSDPLSLGLEKKDYGDGISFSAINQDWYARNGYRNIYSAMSGAMPGWSGERVSLSTALNHSVVWACTRLISETVGFLPLALMQEKNDTKLPAIKHPLWQVLHNAPNAELTAMAFRETLTAHCLLGGNCFARIYRRSGTNVATELDILLPSQVTPDRDKQKRLIYLVKDGNSPEVTYTVKPNSAQDILHIRGLGFDGVRGYSVLEMGRQSIGTALATERYTGTFFAKGARTPYYLQKATRFKTEEDFKRFRSEWESTYADYHKAPIFEGSDVTYHQTGMSARDAQFLEMRLYSIHEICRWFLVSPHLVGDLSRATFSNIEQLALEFVKVTLTVWLTRWEQELWRCVLTPEEKSQGYFFKHNVNALLRGDFASRMSGYATMLQNGIASPNEVRDLEDWNPYPGGGEYHIQLNMQQVPENPQAQQAIPVGTGVDDISAAPEG